MEIFFCLDAKKALNVAKTEVTFFKTKYKILDTQLRNLRKIKKLSKARQDQKSLISVFVYFLSAIV